MGCAGFGRDIEWPNCGWRDDSETPLNPYLVLALRRCVARLRAGDEPPTVRGLMFVFFILLLGAFTLKTAAPDVSIVGKLAGGIFVYAMSILDAYQTARVRFELWRHGKCELSSLKSGKLARHAEKLFPLSQFFLWAAKPASLWASVTASVNRSGQGPPRTQNHKARGTLEQRRD